MAVCLAVGGASWPGEARAEDDKITPLNAACKAGKLDTVRELLAAGASVNQPNPSDPAREAGFFAGFTPLLTTVRQSWKADGQARLAVLQLLLQAGADPNTMVLTTPERSSPDSLGGAIHFAILEWWPEYWKDPRRSRKERQVSTSTLRLTEVNNTYVEKAVRMLLDAGANPNLRRPEDGNTPLHLAARKGSVPLTKLLLKHGADVRSPDNDGFTALTDAVVWGDNPELVSFYESYLEEYHITIDDPRWRHRRWDAFAESFTDFLRFVGYLALPLAYLGGAIYLREGYYREQPQDNWLGTGHAYLMVTGGSVALLGIAGGALASWGASGWGAVGRALLGFLVGGLVVGLPAGILATRYGHMPEHFKGYRALYYLPPSAAVIATTIALTVEF